MTKNEILKITIESLLLQRKELVYELRSINYNEANCLQKQNSLDKSIADIDMQLNLRVLECEINVKK